MSRTAIKTIDHHEIRRWVEDRGGHPAKVVGTERGGSYMLRVSFPDYSGQRELEKISWEDFFRVFEERRLAFLYEDRTPLGEESRFFKIVAR